MRTGFALTPDLEWEQESAPAGGLPTLPGFTPAESRAIWLTNRLETDEYGRLGYGSVSGDFDQMGISLGPLQWNFGAGSLQPLLLEFASAAPQRFAAVFGDGAGELLAMLQRWHTMSRSRDKVTRKAAERELTAWGHAQTVGAKDVRQPWKARFRSLANEPVWRDIVHRKLRDRMNKAYEWLRVFGLGTERGLAFMYDAVASHGGAWPDRKERRARIARGLSERSAALGRGLGEVEKMEVIANVLGDTSAPRWAEKARARKLAIARNRGKVHGHELSIEFPMPLTPLTGGAPAPVPAPSGGSAPSTGSAPSAGVGLASWVRQPLELMLIAKELGQGNRDPNDLTNKVFFSRHPERNGARIQAHEKALAQEWMGIRDTMVAPLLAKVRTGVSAGSSPTLPKPTTFPAPPPPSGTEGAYDGSTPAPGTVETRRSWRTNPPVRSDESNRNAALYEQVINQFAAGKNPRYAHRDGATFCNIFAWDVTSAMGAEIPHWVDGDGDPAAVGKGREMNANATYDWLKRHGPRFGWRPVRMEEGVTLANQGRPVVASWKKPGGIGHIAVVRPGDLHPKAGPLLAQAGAKNRNRIRMYGGDPNFEGVWKTGTPIELFAHA